MANSLETRGFIGTCILLGLSIYLSTIINGVDCSPSTTYPRRSMLLAEGEVEVDIPLPTDPIISLPSAQTVFNVKNYGAKADGVEDDAMAFIQAWRAACDSTTAGPSTVLADGNFITSEVVFTGPCKNKNLITILFKGNLSAVSDPSAYSHVAWFQIQHVNNVEITGGGTFNGHGAEFWPYAEGGSGSVSLPVSFVFHDSSNCKLHDLNFVDSMGFHTKVANSHDITVSNLRITAPGNSPNTDGIHISNVTNIKITDLVIATGDDCVSIGHGSVNILVSGVTCGPGHGLSIGSLGKRVEETNVQGITFRNCTLIGTTNGARIKSFQDSPVLKASNIVYEDIVMNQVKNPIIIDQHYGNKKKPGQSSVKITNVQFKNIRGTTITETPVNLNCSTTYPCENIELTDINLTPIVGLTTLTSACTSAKSVVLKGIQNPPGPVCV